MSRKTTQPRTRNPTYLGKHTAASWLAESNRYNDIPFLKDNYGKLPPFMLLFGDRRRVIDATRELRLRNAVRLDLASEEIFGLQGSGRVNLALGIYSPSGQEKRMPLLLVECQMGGSPNQIILRELWALVKKGQYALDEHTAIKSNGIKAVRCGTAGGILTFAEEKQHPLLDVGDVVVAKDNIGNMGAILQSLGSINFFKPRVFSIYCRRMAELGFNQIIHDGKGNRYIVQPESEEMVKQLVRASQAQGLQTYVGRNFSKDSLYLEADETQVMALRTDFGVFSTEMEQLLINFEAARFLHEHGILVETGLISAIVGIVPGGSFAPDPYKEKVGNTERGILVAGANALYESFLELNP
ncbi:MAG: hypothetical protein ABII22_00550 [Candidatus Micrarchaeota archaeon]